MVHWYFFFFLIEILICITHFLPWKLKKNKKKHFRPNKLGLVDAWNLQWKAFSICLNTGSRTTQSLSAATKPRSLSTAATVAALKSSSRRRRRRSWEEKRLQVLLLFKRFNFQFPLFFYWIWTYTCGTNLQDVEVKSYTEVIMDTTFHMFHDRGSILSAICCFLPTCEGCACLFGSLPLLFDPRDETWHHNPNSKDTISYRYMYFFLFHILFAPILLRALGKQMQNHFQFQSSDVGQQPQMLGNKQAAPGATVCPRSYLCV